MKSLKIFSAALFCANKILGDICAPGGQGSPAPMVSQPAPIENCAAQSQPLVMNPSQGQSNGRSPAECVVSKQNYAPPTAPSGGQGQPPICTAGNGGTPGYPGAPGTTPGTIPGPIQSGTPLIPKQFVPVIPVAKQPVYSQKVTSPPVQQTPPPQNITQVFQQPPPMQTTVIGPPPNPTPNTPLFPPNNPNNPPKKEETQCTMKTTIDCVPTEPEEEVPEITQPPIFPPQNYGPPPQTVVHVNPPPSQPSYPMVPPTQQAPPQVCIPAPNPPVQQAPPSGSNGGSNGVCIPPVAPAPPTQTPANTLYVPTTTTQSSGSSSDCTSPANMINSLCDTAKPVPAGHHQSNQGASCDVPNNAECLAKVVNQPPQVAPQDAAECVTSPRNLVDVGVLAPASDQYVQAHENVCV